MASCFKGPCVVYWVIWFYCLSFTLGVMLYSQYFAMYTEELIQVFNYMIILASFNCFMSMIGCIWLKCDIQHVIPATCFIVPVLVVNISITIIGLISLRGNVFIPNATRAFSDTSKHIKPEGKSVVWFTNTQDQMACCGVYSYLDYPILFNKSIPTACCKDKKKSCQINNELIRNINTSLLNYPTPELVEHLLNCNNSVLELSIENSPFLLHSENLTANISTCGCYKFLHSNMASIGEALFINFIFLMFGSLVMVGVYTKNLCRARGTGGAGGLKGSGSDHSLDVDEGIAVDLPAFKESALIIGGEALSKASSKSKSLRRSVGSVGDNSLLAYDQQQPRPSISPSIMGIGSNLRGNVPIPRPNFGGNRRPK